MSNAMCVEHAAAVRSSLVCRPSAVAVSFVRRPATHQPQLQRTCRGAPLPSSPKSSVRRTSSPCRCAVRGPGPAGSCPTVALNAVFSHCSPATNRISAPGTIEAILGNCISRFARAVTTVEVLVFVPLLREMYLFQPHPCVACHEFVTHETAKNLVAAIQTRGMTIFVTWVTR